MDRVTVRLSGPFRDIEQRIRLGCLAEAARALGLEFRSDAGEHEASWPALQARRRRWAELLRLVFKVDVEVCARCGGEAHIIGFVTEPQVIRRILAHLDRRGVDARAGPWTGVAAAPG